MVLMHATHEFELRVDTKFKALGPVVRSLVSANRWLRGIKTCNLVKLVNNS